MVDSCMVSKVNVYLPTGFYLTPPSVKHPKFQLKFYSLPVMMLFKHLIFTDIYSIEGSENWASDRKAREHKVPWDQRWKMRIKPTKQGAETRKAQNRKVGSQRGH